MVAFARTVYLADAQAAIGAGANIIAPIKVHPAVLSAGITVGTSTVLNTPTTDPPNIPISAIVSRSGRSIGLHAKKVHAIVTSAGTSPYVVGERITIPALTPGFYASAIKDRTLSFNGATLNITGTTAEKVV